MPNYWKIRAGEGGRLWDSWRTRHIITIGWDIGKLEQLSLEEVKKRIREEYQQKNPGIVASMIRKFAGVPTRKPCLKKGDIVIVLGVRAVLDIAQVIDENYHYQQEGLPSGKDHTYWRDVEYRNHKPVRIRDLPTIFHVGEKATLHAPRTFMSYNHGQATIDFLEQSWKEAPHRFLEETRIEEIDIPRFAKSINFKKVRYEPQSLRNPERIKIRDIISKVEKEWVLPNFQRYFDWKRDDVKSFLESIFNDYYVGAFLLWDIKEKPELDVINIKGVRSEVPNPKAIILDGQQRITSLYYAVKTPEFKLKPASSPSRVYFYISFRSFFSEEENTDLIEYQCARYGREESYRRMLFPFYELETYADWVDGFEDFLVQHKPKITETQIRSIRRAIEKRLRHIWDGFEIPFIRLSESMGLKQVTDIFERLNTKGKTLSVFDLLIARLLINKINLRRLWDKCREEYSSTIRRYAKASMRSPERVPIYIFQAISLFHNQTSSCKRGDILDIYKLVYKDSDFSFADHWREFSGYVSRAIKKLENMRSGFGVKDEKHVPFIPMIPILAALLKEIDSREDKADCFKKLKTWYWASVFSNAYSSAVNSTLTSHFKEMRSWFADDANIPKTVENARKQIQILGLREIKVKSNAIYKGVLSLLALEGAKDFDTNQELRAAPRNHRDHIFPRSKKRGFGSHKDVESILNMTWMSEETNTRIKNSRRPKEYVKWFIANRYNNREEEFLNNLETHFINRSAYECMLRDDIESFLNEREKSIISKIKTLFGIEEIESSSGLITPHDPFKNRILYEKTISACDGFLHWIDKYFSKKGLIFLADSIEPSRTKEIKILMSADRATKKFRDYYKDFRESMKNKGITCELRVIANSKLLQNIHDRWILSKNKNFNIPSPDIIARGQYSEIKETKNKPPFDEWWKNADDIIKNGAK